MERSSRTSQRTIDMARSPFDRYGRKELLAKSPSPTTTARNFGALGRCAGQLAFGGHGEQARARLRWIAHAAVGTARLPTSRTPTGCTGRV